MRNGDHGFGDAALPVEFILFDLYETLVSFDPRPIRDARASVAERAGVSVEALCAADQQTMGDRMRGRCGSSVDEELAAVLRRAGAVDHPELLAEFRAAEMNAWRHAAIVHQDVGPCLGHLRSAGVRLGLVSNCSHLTRPLLCDWQLAECFDTLVLSCEVGCAKPDHAILRRAVTDIDAPPGAGMLIDDTEAYVDAARDFGLMACRIARSGEALPDDQPVIADLWHLGELLTALT